MIQAKQFETVSSFDVVKSTLCYWANLVKTTL